ncbi:MAG: transporter substrate-binding domain-containing protein [Eubacterium sp.]|nr:transporter substrate-binding domain-containing protein [Eubacterium sp.]
MKKFLKDYKKIIAIVLSIVVVAGVFAACSQAKKENDADNSNNSVSTVDDELAAIQKAGKFVVGVEGTYAPFTYHDDNGELTGFDVEVAKAVAQKLGVEAEFVEAPWDSLLAGVDSGRLDTVINCVSISDERKEKYDFSNPYLYITTQIVIRNDNDSIKTVADLKGKKVAANTTNIYAPWFEENGATIVPIETSSDAVNLLVSGRADFIGFNALLLQSYLKEHPDTEIHPEFEIPASEELVAIPIKKGESRLVEAVNKALEELQQDGTLKTLSEKYFSDNFTESANK